MCCAGGPRPQAIDGPNAEDTARARAAFAWIAVFFVLVLLAGFRWGMPLAVLAYYRLEARVGWVAAVSAAAACAAFLHIAVVYLYLAAVRRRPVATLGWAAKQPH